MAMTHYENIAKKEIQRILAQQGYKTYAKILDDFDVNLTDDQSVVGYMIPNKAKIVLNQNLAIDQASMIVRHEILHQVLKHEERLINHLAERLGLNPDNLTNLSLKELQQKLYSNKIFNVAADYEISNVGYTEADKQIARNIYLNGKYIQGLVTEDDHPNWVNLSVEEMYDQLLQEMSQNQVSPPPGQSAGNSENNGKNGDGVDGVSGSGDGNDDGDDSSDTNQNKNDKGNPTIGDQGNRSIQQAEEAARKAADISKELKKDKGNTDAQSAATDMDDISDKARKLIQDAKDAKEDGEITAAEADDLAQRVERIKKAFSDAATKAAIVSETSKAIDAEKVSKAAQAIEKYRTSPLSLFKQSLNKFIKNEVAEVKGTSWSRFNKKYDGTGIIRPGEYRHASGKVPSINVYFDQSGSWTDLDIRKGVNAISVLNYYVNQGLIKLNIYYFAINVHKSPELARQEGGTSAKGIIQHIQETNPDNVIIMTDSDTTRERLSTVEIKGACWFLFKNGESSDALINAIHAKKGTKMFSI